MFQPPVIKRIDSYAQHFACFACRKMFKQHIADEVAAKYASRREFHQEHRPPCLQCGQPMLNMGLGSSLREAAA